MGQRGPKKGSENAGRPPGTRRAIGRLKGPTPTKPVPKKAAAKKTVEAIGQAPVAMTLRDLQRLKFPALVQSITNVRGHPPHVGIVTLLYHSLQQYFEFDSLYQQLLKNAKANAAHVEDSEWQRKPELYNGTDKGFVVEHPVVARKIKQADQCTKLLKECMVTPWVQARLVPDAKPDDDAPPESNTGPKTDDLQQDWDAGTKLPLTPPDDTKNARPANTARRRKVPGQRAERKTAGRKAGAAGDRKTSPGSE